jgi:hypothetical protein
MTWAKKALSQRANPEVSHDFREQLCTDIVPVEDFKDGDRRSIKGHRRTLLSVQF